MDIFNDKPGKNGNGRKILLHACCGPCAAASVERLMDNGRQVMLYFSNSNINSREEFDKRLEAAEKLVKYFGIELVVDPYRHDDWLEYVKGLENEPEKGRRCSKCFDWSLRRTSLKAAEFGIENFTTTLTVSPHKVSRHIFEAGEKYEGFEPWDFKKKDGFLRTMQLSRELGLYCQGYCGCEFSMRPDQNKAQKSITSS
jgi:predicted adenine nucleotide alpha hydrolase (AANH) superfamily ATPase